MLLLIKQDEVTHNGRLTTEQSQLLRSLLCDSIRGRICKQTCFSSTHFLSFPGVQPSAGILPVSGYSGIHGGAGCYIQPASAL
ncbi:unnamed protein product (plasmid) [Klebsiella pneumoniae]|nr:unnamed protein product [Klebsiella pneumoniae]